MLDVKCPRNKWWGYMYKCDIEPILNGKLVAIGKSAIAVSVLGVFLSF